MRKVLIAGFALLTLAALALVVLDGRPGRAAPVERAGPLAYRFTWPAGSRYLYDLSWTADQQARVAEAFVEIEATGRVRGVRFAKSAPPAFQQLVMGLVGELEVVVPAAPATSWS